MKNKNIVTTTVIILAFVGLIIWFGKPIPPNGQNGNLSSAVSEGTLVASEPSFDFGTISMATGKVKREIKVKNTGTEAVTVIKMYTSCMCTEASFLQNGKKMGPFGMPGHGFVPKINSAINPNEEIIVEVVFDPTAHGPAGVGKIERVVTLENNSSSDLNIMFSAFVTP